MREFSVPAKYTPGPHSTAVDDIYDNALKRPDHVAVSRRIDGAWTPVTSLMLSDDIEALAAGLLCSGIEPGDRVALMARTCYEWLLYDFAILSVGAVTVPIYETSSAEQVEWILFDSGAVAAVIEQDAQLEMVEQMRDRLPALHSVWPLVAGRFELLEAGFGVRGELVAERRNAIGPDTLATIVYTSGTTGRPKGCMLTHGNLLSLTRNVVAADGIDEVFNDRESTLLFLPLAHILARVIQNGALHAGVRLGHAPDMASVPEDLQSFQPSVVLSVPRIFEKIYNGARHKAVAAGKGRIFDKAESVARDYSEALDAGGPSLALRAEHALFDRLVYGKIRHAMGGHVRWAVSGGAPLGAHLGHFFRGIGINVLEGYGLTETTAGGTINLPHAQRVGSTGLPLPGGSVKIADDGEILLKGGFVFGGYWQNKDATAEVFDEDGWFRTGDIGRLDEDGFVYVTDRKKDLIVTSAGKNVAPAVLEDRLRSHWLVSQALVVGDRRAYIGVLLTVDDEAFRTWKQEAGKPDEATADALQSDPDFAAVVQEAVDSANAAVSRAEAIKRWIVLPEDFTVANGEITPTLKLRRRMVTDRYAAQVEALYTPQ
jgi:long-chain acyl-CoA synthetase